MSNTEAAYINVLKLAKKRGDVAAYALAWFIGGDEERIPGFKKALCCMTAPSVRKLLKQIGAAMQSAAKDDPRGVTIGAIETPNLVANALGYDTDAACSAALQNL